MRVLRIAVLAAVALVVAACASTTGGSGTVGGASTSSTAPTDFPASTGQITSAAPPSGSTSRSVDPSSFPSVPPPKECATRSDCKVVKSYEFGHGGLVAVFSAPDASGGAGAAVLMMSRNETPTYWHVFDGETPGELLCLDGPVRNCALVNYVGAHAATVYPLAVASIGITIGPSVGSDTPGLHVGDLDGDRLVDAWGLQNDYKPDYASGHVQWQTWQRSADGISFKSTGCGALTSGATAPKPPKYFVTGPCAAG